VRIILLRALGIAAELDHPSLDMRRRHLTPRLCQAMFRHLWSLGLIKLHLSLMGFAVDGDACRAWRGPRCESAWRRRTRQRRIDPFAGLEI
jgi:hypothetical protein